VRHHPVNTHYIILSGGNALRPFRSFGLRLLLGAIAMVVMGISWHIVHVEPQN
jgi:hypothetical protein